MVGVLNSTIEQYCTGMPVGCENPEAQGCKPCGCEDNSNGRVILDLFDEMPGEDEEGTSVPGRRGDCEVTLEELKNNTLINKLTKFYSKFINSWFTKI